MILKSFAKINLSLNVNKLLVNGLHDIQSYFCLINLFDPIRIKKIKGNKDIIKFSGKFAKLINKRKNSISETLKILRNYSIIKDHYSIQVEKKIPVFGGLGGGTSNAACLVKYFYKKGINKNLLITLEKKIGSDLKLFFYNQGFLKSFTTINNLKKKHKLFFLLVYPNIKCPTKYIYSKVRKYSSKSKYNYNKINSKKKFIKLLIDSHNDLQLIVQNKYSIVRKLLLEIKEKKGCCYSRMTGSGSVCYGMFVSKKKAQVALTKIKSKYPKFWFSVAKTI